jgi:Rad3-related DNA helicase
MGMSGLWCRPAKWTTPGASSFSVDFLSTTIEPWSGLPSWAESSAKGIDLVGERLSGAIIVGVGLPAICRERNLIRDYFDERGTGFDFAYRYPGINRVLQAAGRVIRTDQDRGALLLVDQRFCRPGYQRLLPVHWSTSVVESERQMNVRLERFWSAVSTPCESPE